MLLGVPFAEGYLLAADAAGPARVRKLPWGLVAAPRGVTLDGAWRSLAQGEEPTASAFARTLLSLIPGAESAWLFTFEPRLAIGPFEGLVPPTGSSSPLAGPVEGYRVDGIGAVSGGAAPALGVGTAAADAAAAPDCDSRPDDPSVARRLGWGGIIAEPGEDRELVRQAGLVLQQGLDEGSGMDARIGAALWAFAYVGERAASFAGDVDVGLHESDRRFSVDRIAWSVVG